MWDGRDYRYVQLTEMSRHISIFQGDTVVTSGLTSVFPQGIIVGEVEETHLKEGDNYHQTKVKLGTDYKALKYVQVLRNKNKKHYGMD
jgi:rod shape-determining protein MreC